MERRQRRSFTDAYKRQAVDLVASRELTVSNSGPLISQHLPLNAFRQVGSQPKSFRSILEMSRRRWFRRI